MKIKNQVHDFVVLTLVVYTVNSCSPGKRYGYRNHASKEFVPLLRGQFVPYLSENTIGASGPKEDKISIGSPAFHDLVQNYNTMIIFSDKHGYGRLMTQRCKDRVDTLAMLVVNVWPAVKLRITRAWSRVGDGSLHEEGRAIDFTTSDRDKKKYGVLARLAVEAGFDWVHYKSRSSVHASVRSDKSGTTRYGGCFPSDSLVYPENGNPIPLRDLSVGDRILASDRHTGELVCSDVIMMMDKMDNVSAEFLEIRTEFGIVTLSDQHILFTVQFSSDKQTTTHPLTSRPVYAKNVKPGDFVFTHPTVGRSNYSSALSPSRVQSIRRVVRNGVFAPLTILGTVVVDATVASCYSSFYSETIAHASFWPVRTFRFLRQPRQQSGVHWYPGLLARIVEFLWPSSFFQS